jgi:hypothetical protein
MYYYINKNIFKSSFIIIFDLSLGDKMVPCPKCGTHMDFIGKQNEWYCSSCRMYSPQFPHQTQKSDSRKKTWILIVVIVIIIVIGGIVGYIGYKEYSKPTFNIKNADLEVDGDEYKFTHTFSYNNFPRKEEEIRWIITVIKNDTVYEIFEMNMTIYGPYSDGATGIRYFDSKHLNPTPDKYRVKVFWSDKLMDSVEKDI